MSDQTAIVGKIHTCCKDCFFATYDDITQTGCSIDRLNKYREINEDFVLECYDNEAEFFLVNHMICLYYVDKQRLAQDTTKEELFAAIRRLIKIRYHVIILVHDSNIDNLNHTLRSLKQQDHPPILLTIIKLHDCQIPGAEIFKAFHRIYTDPNQQPQYRIQNPVNPELTKEDYIDIAIDGTKNEKYGFYCIFNSGFEIPREFGHKLDVAVNDDMQRFQLVTANEDGNGMIVPLTAHLRCSGNSHGVYLQTKIEAELCDENKILQINQLFPELF